MQSTFTQCLSKLSAFCTSLSAHLLLILLSCIASSVVRAQDSAVLVGVSDKPTVVQKRSEEVLSLKAIGGTGRTTKAIGGTGRTTKAIGGTGRTTKAIGGTGRTTKAIGGTGRTTKAIGGTGRTTKAIGGTGRTTKAIGGTGRTTKAIGGTGRTTKAIAGSGNVTEVQSGANELLNLPLIRGVVEAWDREGRNLRVLGQILHVDGTEQFAIGDVAVIEGRIDSSGKIAADYVWVDSSEQFVLGSTQVVVTGQVLAVDALNGKLLIGSLLVDYTQLLWDNSFAPTAGSVLTVVGTQAIADGDLQANQAEFN